MAEEQDNKQKRKTTLIKHRKPESSKETGATQEKSEKKKVVVVKKKVVKVKRPSGEPTSRKVTRKSGEPTEAKPAKAKEPKAEPAQPEESGGTKATETTGTRSTRPSRPGFLGSSPREPSPFERYAKGGGPEPVRGGGRETTRMPASGGSRTPGKAGPREQEQRGRDVRGRAGLGERSGGARGTESGATAETKKGDEAKHGSKKFFKAKKKTAFQRKKREEHEEKLMPVKKKTVRRANPVPKDISILENITVSELAKKMNLKASELIGRLMKMGMMVTINQQIDSETAAILADEYDCKVNVVSLFDETVIEEEKDRDEDLVPRPPVVTVMGHVDHGKTKLLDAIRETDVVAGEHGGITQHIGAYTVELPQGKVTFLDTPGHEAFTAMRARGALLTDIVVLVVAADDGVMPQTIEAVNHAKAANTPIIVAVNKVDLEDANPERVKQQLAEYDLLPEDWGGSTLYVEVSALKKQGIDTLLESILLQAEILELKANRKCRAQGTIIESKVDLGRGIVATVLIEKGTLQTGESYVAGVFPGKVRAMFNDKGNRIDEAYPSTPVEILGLAGLPNAGDPFHATEDEKTARQIGSKRQELKKMESARNVNKITLDNLYDQIKQGEVRELKVIVKGDVHGSVEALEQALERLSTGEVKLSVIHSSAGAINDNDVLLSSAYNAIIVGFHVRPTPSAQSLADREKVEIRTYNVIYDVVDDIRSAMEGMLAPELREEVLGTAEVRDTFKVPKIGIIAGCYVVSGKVRRGASAHVIRDGVQIYSGKVSSLKRFKDDAREVDTGFECGIGIESFNDLKVGDQIEVFEVKEFAKTLEESRSDAGDTKEKD